MPGTARCRSPGWRVRSSVGIPIHWYTRDHFRPDVAIRSGYASNRRTRQRGEFGWPTDQPGDGTGTRPQYAHYSEEQGRGAQLRRADASSVYGAQSTAQREGPITTGASYRVCRQREWRAYPGHSEFAPPNWES